VTVAIEAEVAAAEAPRCTTKKCPRAAVREGLCGRCASSARAKARAKCGGTFSEFDAQRALDERLRAVLRGRLAQV
jgi:uncharacterized low-complexity protein